MGSRSETDEMYVVVNSKRLRCGYTTGSCATAASKMAAIILLGGERKDVSQIITPNGTRLSLKVEEIVISGDSVKCAVRKDAGDDIDATDKILICSSVSKRTDGKIVIDGGEGVGRVTKKGLDQSVGEAAINTVPRNMIREVLEEACRDLDHRGGLTAVISVPDGLKISNKTFNERMGIIGGISILGTTGIVDPMSDSALVDTIRAELKMRRASGDEYILVVPGNYGKDFSDGMEGFDGERAVKCSNFVGETIDIALELGFKGLLLVGNLGKMVKLAGGIMNTHSRWGDCRMEIMSANSISAGADIETARAVLSCVSTDDALETLRDAGMMERTMEKIMEKIAFHLSHRNRGEINIECIVFSSKFGKLGETPGVRELFEKIKEEGNE